MEMKPDNKYRYWLYFVEKGQEELFDIISAMIIEKVEQILPQMIEEQLRIKTNSMSFDFQTTINGKSVEKLKEVVSEMIINELK